MSSPPLRDISDCAHIHVQLSQLPVWSDDDEEDDVVRQLQEQISWQRQRRRLSNDGTAVMKDATTVAAVVQNDAVAAQQSNASPPDEPPKIAATDHAAKVEHDAQRRAAAYPLDALLESVTSTNQFCFVQHKGCYAPAVRLPSHHAVLTVNDHQIKLTQARDALVRYLGYASEHKACVQAVSSKLLRPYDYVKVVGAPPVKLAGKRQKSQCDSANDNGTERQDSSSKDDDTKVAHDGGNKDDDDKVPAPRSSSSAPPPPPQWSAALLQEHVDMVAKMKSVRDIVDGHERAIKLRMEALVLQRCMTVVAEQQQQCQPPGVSTTTSSKDAADAATTTLGDDSSRCNNENGCVVAHKTDNDDGNNYDDDEEQSVPDRTTFSPRRVHIAARQPTQWQKPAGDKLPLRAGDVISYYRPTFVAQTAVTATITAVHPGYAADFALETRAGDLLGRQDRVRLVQRYVRGKLQPLTAAEQERHGRGRWPVGSFKLDKSYNDKVPRHGQQVGDTFRAFQENLVQEGLRHLDNGRCEQHNDNDTKAANDHQLECDVLSQPSASKIVSQDSAKGFTTAPPFSPRSRKIKTPTRSSNDINHKLETLLEPTRSSATTSPNKRRRRRRRGESTRDQVHARL